MEKPQIDIKYVAALARLEIRPEQAERLQNDLQNIVEYINELGELDIPGWSRPRTRPRSRMSGARMKPVRRSTATGCLPMRRR